MAYNIELTKAPLKFPDHAINQVTMISYMVHTRIGGSANDFCICIHGVSLGTVGKSKGDNIVTNSQQIHNIAETELEIEASVAA